MKSIYRVLLVNVLIFAGFLFIPAFLFDVYKRLKLASEPPLPSEDLAINPAYPSSEDRKKARQLSNDKEAGMTYKSFVGWRRNPFGGVYKNVLAPHQTRLSSNQAIDNSVWFFGGSTMWGTGAVDSETIPSWYATKTGESVFNLGETAWVSRQSLNQLINLLGDGYKPKRVVFYDGVNDVLHGCRSELETVPAHVQEKQIAQKLSRRPLVKSILLQSAPLGDYLLAPYKAIGGKLGFEIDKPMNYGSMDCSTNQFKAAAVAKHMLNNWYSAYLISRGGDIDFKAVLQPQAFMSKIKKDYLHPAENYLEPEYLAVYPLIKQEIHKYCLLDSGFCSNILIGTAWLDGADPVYIDFCHLTGKGNEIIAKNLID